MSRFVMTNGYSKTYWSSLEDATRNLSETVAKAFKAGQDIAEWHIETETIELTREQRIEKAAREMVEHYAVQGHVPLWAVYRLRDALASPAAQPAPSEATEEEMRRVAEEPKCICRWQQSTSAYGMSGGQVKRVDPNCPVHKESTR